MGHTRLWGFPLLGWRVPSRGTHSPSLPPLKHLHSTCFALISRTSTRLCFYVIRSFLPSLPAGCRHAHPVIKTGPASRCSCVCHAGSSSCRHDCGDRMGNRWRHLRPRFFCTWVYAQVIPRPCEPYRVGMFIMPHYFPHRPHGAEQQRADGLPAPACSGTIAATPAQPAQRASARRPRSRDLDGEQPEWSVRVEDAPD